MLDSLQFINTEYPWFFQVFAFIFGAIVGSFLNVCIHRIPAGKSIITPGSTCACGQPIAWYDNIPILSWFILRGRARCCGQPYSFRYPAIEFLTGCLFFLAWYQHPPAKAVCLMIFVSMLICGSFIDFDHMEIPDRFSIGLAFVGFALSVIFPTLHSLDLKLYAPASVQAGFQSMVGILIGSSVILWIGILADKVLKKEALGFGDVKLLGGIGAFLGWQGAIFSIFGGAAIGTVGILFFVVFKKLFSRKSNESDDGLLGRQIPFGPMLSAGAVLYALFLENAVDRYFDQISFLFRQ